MSVEAVLTPEAFQVAPYLEPYLHSVVQAEQGSAEDAGAPVQATGLCAPCSSNAFTKMVSPAALIDWLVCSNTLHMILPHLPGIAH